MVNIVSDVIVALEFSVNCLHVCALLFAQFVCLFVHVVVTDSRSLAAEELRPLDQTCRTGYGERELEGCYIVHL